jgi:hypothetical protein
MDMQFICMCMSLYRSRLVESSTKLIYKILYSYDILYRFPIRMRFFIIFRNLLLFATRGYDIR